MATCFFVGQKWLSSVVEVVVVVVVVVVKG